jgi:hypothetical protein
MDRDIVDSLAGGVASSSASRDDDHWKPVATEVERQRPGMRFDAALEGMIVSGQDEHAGLRRQRLFSHGVRVI